MKIPLLKYLKMLAQGIGKHCIPSYFKKKREYFQATSANPRSKMYWVWKSKEVDVLSGGGIYSVSQWVEWLFLQLAHVSAIWKKDCFELFWQWNLMSCGSTLGRCCALLHWVTGRAGLPSSCKEVIHLITWKKGNCQVTMVMFLNVLF